jgi:hypothetical protein
VCPEFGPLCCRERDLCYSDCFQSKSDCDTQFWVCMMNECIALSDAYPGTPGLWEGCSTLAWRYDMASQVAGCPLYEAARAMHCR